MLRKQRRIALPVIITVFWLVMLGLFVSREYSDVFAPDPPTARSPFVPRNEWMGIYVGDDQRVGYLHMRSMEERRNDTDGHTVRLDAALETTLFGTTAAMDIVGEAWTARDGSRAEFDASLRAADTEMAARGLIVENRLTGTLNTGGESVPLDFPVDERFDLTSTLGLPAETMPLLGVGESTTIEAFDPVSMRPASATVTCVGEEPIFISGASVAARIYETEVGGMSSRSWVSETGEVLQASTPFGLTLRKIDAAALAETIVPAGTTDLIQQLAIVPTGEAVPEHATRLVISLTGVAPDEIPHAPPFQVREGRVLTLTQPALPVDSDTTAPPIDPAPYLESDPFVTAAHPDIVDRARAIVQDEQDPWRQVVRIHDWLFEHIEKKPVLSVPNALDVLRTRQGDCNEHTVLFTALSRSLAIPTRIAIGLVHSEHLGGFGYHAWPEVHVNGRWHPLDPTLGQLAADATHIKLLNGSISTWVRLASFMGQIAIEVQESDGV